MSAYSSKSSVAAYRSVSAHSGVAAANPHGLVLLLLDGVLERLSSARGAMERGETEAKSRLIHRAVAIVEELRASLNVAEGGQIASNLADLYEYCGRLLLRANLENRTETLEEVGNLLREIRSAWIQIPAASR